MKKEYTNPTIEIVILEEKDIIVMSNFGQSLAGDQEETYDSLFN